MVWFLDELIREGANVQSATVLTLTGERQNHRRFRDALRRDGNPVQSNDRTCVSVFQANTGFATCAARLTLGATDTLTLDASKVYQSSAWPALPTFSPAGAPCDVYVTAAVPLLAQFDEDGNLLQPDLFRKSIVTETIVNGFMAELGTTDNEAVVALGAAAAFDELAGVFAFDADLSTIADNVDIFENDHTSSGRARRLSLKPWPTQRGDIVAAGNVIELVQASKPGEQRLINVWTTNGASRARAHVIGDAADPIVDVIDQYGDITIELSGVSVRARNNGASSMTINHIKPIIG